MSSKRLSPTASLLRTSRMFSLPPPLPRPNSKTPSSIFDSDTATTPYPTHAAIATPQSSLHRGDWGLKRPLPLRSTTRTTTPTVRVAAVDTQEHFTDFESAADHTRTLRKWQEFNIPISRMNTDSGGSHSRSLDARTRTGFEDNFDLTDLDGSEATREGGRWKYRGPWLAGQEEGEFMKYVRTQIRRRKGEFREYVRRDAAERELADRRRVAVEKGQTPPLEDASTPPEAVISDKQLQLYLVALRKDRSKLNDLIQGFLDLPAQPESRNFLQLSAAAGTDLEPHSTHPSAGLSYLRTAAHVPNHPILGPQAHSKPVQARVLVTPYSVTGKRVLAKLGVGGVVTDGQMLSSSRMNESVPGVTVFDPKVEGGGKVWVHPVHAEVNADGKIRLSVDKANDSVVEIHQAGSKSDKTESSDFSPKEKPADEALDALFRQATETLQ
ncbi:MAG: Chitin synthase, class 2 [Chaenotheca gracillima]|nr:MAG: Chitin synthase, class 2 [Chaenotheca gracillima]